MKMRSRSTEQNEPGRLSRKLAAPDLSEKSALVEVLGESVVDNLSRLPAYCSTLLAGDLDHSGHSVFRNDHAPVDEQSCIRLITGLQRVLVVELECFG